MLNKHHALKSVNAVALRNFSRNACRKREDDFLLREGGNRGDSRAKEGISKSQTDHVSKMARGDHLRGQSSSDSSTVALPWDSLSREEGGKETREILEKEEGKLLS